MPMMYPLYNATSGTTSVTFCPADHGWGRVQFAVVGTLTGAEAISVNVGTAPYYNGSLSMNLNTSRGNFPAVGNCTYVISGTTYLNAVQVVAFGGGAQNF